MDQNSVDDLLAQIQQQTADIQAHADAAPGDAAAHDALTHAQATVDAISGDISDPGAPAPGDILAGEFAAPAAPVASAAKRPGAAARQPGEVSRLMAIEVPVIVQLGKRRMTVAEVMRLSVGAIVEFAKAADEELELLVNNKPIGQGHAVKVGENFGIKITQVGTVKDTIRRLGAG